MIENLPQKQRMQNGTDLIEAAEHYWSNWMAQH